MMRKPKRFGLVAVLFAFLLTLAPTTAVAATVVGDVSDLDIAAIDADATISLTVKKPLPNPYDELPPDQKPAPVEGVELRAQRIVGVDLTVHAGWDAARTMSIDDAQLANYDVERFASFDASGEAHFAPLPVGLYLISENSTEAATAPFLITLPIGSSSEGVWLYDVVVTAKSLPPHPEPSQPVPSSVPTVPPSENPDTLATTGATSVSILLALGALLVIIGAASATRASRRINLGENQ